MSEAKIEDLDATKISRAFALFRKHISIVIYLLLFTYLFIFIYKIMFTIRDHVQGKP